MRILLLTHSYTPEVSPPQRRWSQFITHFRQRGWEVDVVAPIAHLPEGRRTLPKDQAGRAFRRHAGDHGERIRRVPFLPHRTTRLGRLANHLFSAACSIPAALMGPRPDVVVVTVPSLPILGAGYLAARLLRAPLAVDMRDAWPDIARDARLVQGSAKSVVERIIIAIQDRADLVVTVTYGFAEILRQRGLKNVATVSNGVDLDFIEELPEPSAAPGRLEVVYLGNHGESQRLDVVVKAAALVGDKMQLTMVGHGVERNHLIELAAELDAPVEFHPPANRTAVMEYYRRADTCVVSLRDDWKSFESTIPSKTYEVLALGRHVTGIVRGEARKILDDSGAGDVVGAYPEAVAQLWRDLLDDRSRLATGGRGREWVRNNANVPALAASYMELLESVAAAGRTAAAGKRP
ncbi:glycosyltransferase family 4 protein [Arthrobacter mobilis]|uniref:D-inositol 3-phosphate glycosyltransferase n=1 Tax=Arthrobacter mobilis TaxID=2724944 RepID=A0A7X6HGU1_9MICC|nr:glycosyltransferase family 4 protein [Arthrobacter mobilis]NKX55367.1 glycosyltransferase family 4 protein [Arthrobacter mobilis]